MRPINAGGAILGLATAAAEAQPPPDKSRYHLFDPTPREMWRALSPDRPDVTESPYSVDAGAVQIEASFLEYGRDGGDPDTEALAVAPVNLKLGLTNRVDLQLVLVPWTRERTTPSGGPGATAEGFGDLTLRSKINLWGNEGGATALGLLPILSIPTGTAVSDDEVQGGVALPFAWGLAEGLAFGAMAEIDVVHDAEEGDHDVEFLHTATLGFTVAGDLGAFVEYAGVAGPDYVAVFSTGLTIAISPDLLLDAGARIGLTGSAEDVTVFSGFTVRF